ncbi:MAG: hypothetical protein WA694_12955, partial [Pseudolabrys sp.]
PGAVSEVPGNGRRSSGIDATYRRSEVGTMDANSGAPWSEADISDLKNELDHGRTIAETASFLCRDVYEVRAKMKELKLTEQPSKRRVVL